MSREDEPEEFEEESEERHEYYSRPRYGRPRGVQKRTPAEIKEIIKRLDIEEPAFVNKSNIKELEEKIEEKIEETYFSKAKGTVRAYTVQEMEDIKDALSGRTKKERPKKEIKISEKIAEAVIRQGVAYLGNMAANISWDDPKSIDVVVYRLSEKTSSKYFHFSIIREWLTGSTRKEFIDAVKGNIASAFELGSKYEGIKPELIAPAEEENKKMRSIARFVRTSYAKDGRYAARTSWVIDDEGIWLVKDIFSHRNKVPTFIERTKENIAKKKAEIGKETRYLRRRYQNPRTFSIHEGMEEVAKQNRQLKRKSLERSKPPTKEFLEKYVTNCIEKTGKYEARLNWWNRTVWSRAKEAEVTINSLRVKIFDKKSLAFRPITSIDIEFYPDDWKYSKYSAVRTITEHMKELATEYNLLLECAEDW